MRVATGNFRGAHLMQLFDSDESLADAVSAYLYDGFALGETLLAVMDEQRWYAVAMRLSARGMPVDRELAAGSLIVRDAAETLTRFMPRSQPDRDLFESSVGNLVRELSARGRRLRIYGEMVDLLAGRGEHGAAQELEALWNDLGRRSRFDLFCGYSSAHFGDPRYADALRRVCASHSKVMSGARDVLGSYLVGVSPPTT
jgi:hypothetical protein